MSVSSSASASASAAAPAESVQSPPLPAAASPSSSLSTFSTPHFQSLQWRLDVQRYSRAAGEMDRPTAIVQIQTKQTIAALRTAAQQPGQTAQTTNTQQLQFEMDRATAANALLEFERIEAIMAGAQ